MKVLHLILVGAALMAGCREATPPQPADKPIETPAAEAAPKGTVGSAVVDVITQRSSIEAGKKAKATIESVAAKENKDLEEALAQ